MPRGAASLAESRNLCPAPPFSLSLPVNPNWPPVCPVIVKPPSFSHLLREQYLGQESKGSLRWNYCFLGPRALKIESQNLLDSCGASGSFLAQSSWFRESQVEPEHLISDKFPGALAAAELEATLWEHVCRLWQAVVFSYFVSLGLLFFLNHVLNKSIGYTILHSNHVLWKQMVTLTGQVPVSPLQPYSIRPWTARCQKQDAV